MKHNKDILYADIQGLEVDLVFKNGSAKMGFYSLNEILALTIVEMMGKEGFSFRWLNALIYILDENDLIDRL